MIDSWGRKRQRYEDDGKIMRKSDACAAAGAGADTDSDSDPSEEVVGVAGAGAGADMGQLLGAFGLGEFVDWFRRAAVTREDLPSFPATDLAELGMSLEDRLCFRRLVAHVARSRSPLPSPCSDLCSRSLSLSPDPPLPSILILPDALLLRIFSLIGPAPACAAVVAPVCRRWRILAMDEAVWRVVVLSETEPNQTHTVGAHVAIRTQSDTRCVSPTYVPSAPPVLASRPCTGFRKDVITQLVGRAPQLQSLTVRAQRMTDSWLIPLERVAGSLTALDLSACRALNTGCAIVAARLTALQHLRLSRPPPTPRTDRYDDPPPRAVFSRHGALLGLTRLMHLKTLTVHGVDDVFLEAMADSLSSLTALHVSVCEPVHSSQALSIIARLPRLEHLTVERGSWDGGRPVDTAPLAALIRLREVRLDMVLCDDTSLSFCSHLPQLAELELQLGRSISLHPLKGASALHSLVLWMHTYQDAALGDTLPQLPVLESLRVSRAPTDMHEWVARLPCLQRLAIALSDVLFDGPLCDALLQCNALRALELRFEGARDGPRHFSKLGGMTQLTQLHVAAPPHSTILHFLDTLRCMLPHCAITGDEPLIS